MRRHLQKSAHLRQHIAVHRCQLHGLRVAVHMHQANAAARMRRDDGRSPGLAQRPDVVDDVGAHITSGLQVSTETGAPKETAARTTGSTRASSCSSGTAVLPGRVDSPPMSSMSAPSLSSCSQCCTAVAVLPWRPPSENESGVTLTMPMTRGRVRSMEKRAVCQIMKPSVRGRAPRRCDRRDCGKGKDTKITKTHAL